MLTTVGLMACGSDQPGHTAPFQATYHGLVRGFVTDFAGQPVSGADITVRFDAPSLGVTTPGTRTDVQGRFELSLRHFGGPETGAVLDSAAGVVYVALPVGGNPVRANDSTSVVVRFAPLREAAPVSTVQIQLR